MAYDLSGMLVIGISSRALFDLEHENAIFNNEGVEAYTAYQREHENDPLLPGTAFPLVKALLKLNHLIPGRRLQRHRNPQARHQPRRLHRRRAYRALSGCLQDRPVPVA